MRLKNILPVYPNGKMEEIYLNESLFNEKIEYIIEALKERGYDPYMQLLGYITEHEPTYITSHNGARALIQTLDFEQVKQYVHKM